MVSRDELLRLGGKYWANNESFFLSTGTALRNGDDKEHIAILCVNVSNPIILRWRTKSPTANILTMVTADTSRSWIFYDCVGYVVNHTFNALLGTFNDGTAGVLSRAIDLADYAIDFCLSRTNDFEWIQMIPKSICYYTHYFARGSLLTRIGTPKCSHSPDVLIEHSSTFRAVATVFQTNGQFSGTNIDKKWWFLQIKIKI